MALKTAFIEIAREVWYTYAIQTDGTESVEQMTQRCRDGEGTLVPGSERPGQWSWSKAIASSYEQLSSSGVPGFPPKRIRNK